MTNKVEYYQRKFDNKWVRWELMDSFKPKSKGGIGYTNSWNRWVWVITDVSKGRPHEGTRQSN